MGYLMSELLQKRTRNRRRKLDGDGNETLAGGIDAGFGESPGDGVPQLVVEERHDNRPGGV